MLISTFCNFTCLYWLQERYGYQAEGMVGPSLQTQEHLLPSQQSRPVNIGDRTFMAGIEVLQQFTVSLCTYIIILYYPIIPPRCCISLSNGTMTEDGGCFEANNPSQ